MLLLLKRYKILVILLVLFLICLQGCLMLDGDLGGALGVIAIFLLLPALVVGLIVINHMNFRDLHRALHTPGFLKDYSQEVENLKRKAKANRKRFKKQEMQAMDPALRRKYYGSRLLIVAGALLALLFFIKYWVALGSLVLIGSFVVGEVMSPLSDTDIRNFRSMICPRDFDIRNLFLFFADAETPLGLPRLDTLPGISGKAIIWGPNTENYRVDLYETPQGGELMLNANFCGGLPKPRKNAQGVWTFRFKGETAADEMRYHMDSALLLDMIYREAREFLREGDTPTVHFTENEELYFLDRAKIRPDGGFLLENSALEPVLNVEAGERILVHYIQPFTGIEAVFSLTEEATPGFSNDLKVYRALDETVFEDYGLVLQNDCFLMRNWRGMIRLQKAELVNASGWLLLEDEDTVGAILQNVQLNAGGASLNGPLLWVENGKDLPLMAALTALLIRYFPF